MNDPNRIDVLDHGYVLIDDVMGDDNRVLRAAYASTKMKVGTNRDRDQRVLTELATSDPQHWSPFAHPHVSMEFKAPGMVVDQWYKTVIDSLYAGEMHAWNRKTFRAGAREMEFYIPDDDQWRMRLEGKRQGSSTRMIDQRVGSGHTIGLGVLVRLGIEQYENALADGIAPEQARLFLPNWSLYTTVYWTASLWTIIRWLKERKHEDAQWEIHQYADAVFNLVQPYFPRCFELLFPPDVDANRMFSRCMVCDQPGIHTHYVTEGGVNADHSRDQL